MESNKSNKSNESNESDNLITELLDFVETERESERENKRLSELDNKNSKKDFKLLEDGFYMAKCEVCKLKFKLSCRYTGEFPLCTSHRDLNSRGNNQKSFKNSNKR